MEGEQDARPLHPRVLRLPRGDPVARTAGDQAETGRPSRRLRHDRPDDGRGPEHGADETAPRGQEVLDQRRRAGAGREDHRMGQEDHRLPRPRHRQGDPQVNGERVSPMADPATTELLQLNARLLHAIATGDWATYQELCDPSLTAFEPEAKGQLVEGMAFHHFYFQLGGTTGAHHTTMCSPRVRLIGDVAVVSYVRLNQRVGGDGSASTTAFEETRVWQRQ